MRFVDTNVLIYAVSPASGEDEKCRAANDLLDREDLTLSVQVLQEFYHQVTRPGRPQALASSQALRFIESLERFPIQEITFDLFRAAAAISRRFQLSYRDGAILAAARTGGCDIVYSEDLSAEQDYGGLRIINPFAEVR
ncbi:MAG: PIN domain-containing protein [Gemmatimonadales bacterium]|nr:PIN domain-containing protein [Gemmatimonadales bacterium]